MRFTILCALLLTALTFAVNGQNKVKAVSTSEVSMTAPEFKATALSGKIYDLAELKGKVVVLNFWTTKCFVCADETPQLNALVDAYGRENVVFLAFAHDGKPRIDQFLKKNPFKYEIVPASLQAMIVPYGKPLDNGFYDIPFPMHILIDQTGVIRVNQIGTNGIAAVNQKLAEIFKK